MQQTSRIEAQPHETNSRHIAPSEAQMVNLKMNLRQILQEIPAGSRVVYLDIPVHLNVGDLLINWGVDVLLKENGIDVALKLCCDDYARFIDRVRPDDVILMHGGGNMNDIWLRHEAMRQDILKKFPTNKIIMLPQTVFFHDVEKGRSFLKSYEAHGNCIIFVRDEASYNFVTRESSVRCVLCPDTAHALWRANDNISPSHTGSGTLLFRRRDLESSNQNAALAGIDWREMIPRMDRWIYWALFTAISHNPFFFIQRGLLAAWYFQRDRIIDKAITKFKSYNTIETDRLHGMILGSLMGKEIKYNDNNYGKLAGYASAWLVPNRKP